MMKVAADCVVRAADELGECTVWDDRDLSNAMGLKPDPQFSAHTIIHRCAQLLELHRNTIQVRPAIDFEKKLRRRACEKVSNPSLVAIWPEKAARRLLSICLAYYRTKRPRPVQPEDHQRLIVFD